MSTELHIVHTSDWHLGCTTDDLADDFFTAVSRFVKTLKKIHEKDPVDLVLIVGDLFDNPDVKSNFMARTIELFMKLKSIFTNDFNEIPPVVVTRGNHDVTTSYRANEGSQLTMLKSMKLAHYIENEVLDNLIENVCIYGVGLSSKNQAKRINELVDEHNLEHDKLNILMVHSGVIGASSIVVKSKPIGNITKEDVQMRHFDYIALGDFHNPYVDKSINLVIPGSLEATSENEWDYHSDFSCFYDVKLTKTGAQRAKMDLEPVRIEIRPKRKFKLKVGDSVSTIQDFQQLIFDEVVPHTKAKASVSLKISMTYKSHNALLEYQLKQIIDEVLRNHNKEPKRLKIKDISIVETQEQLIEAEPERSHDEIVQKFIQTTFALSETDTPIWTDFIILLVDELDQSGFKLKKQEKDHLFNKIDSFLEERT